jgi:hypothetical protein
LASDAAKIEKLERQTELLQKQSELLQKQLKEVQEELARTRNAEEDREGGSEGRSRAGALFGPCRRCDH